MSFMVSFEGSQQTKHFCGPNEVVCLSLEWKGSVHVTDTKEHVTAMPLLLDDLKAFSIQFSFPKE